MVHITPIVSLLICVFGFQFFGFSQENMPTKDGVEFSTAEVNCLDIQNGLDKQYYLITVRNNSTEAKVVKFRVESYYNNRCVGCDEEGYIRLELEPNQEVSGECPLGVKSGLEVFIKHNEPMIENKSRFNSFQIASLLVTPIHSNQ